MDQDCEMLAECGFFSRYGAACEQACQVLIRWYCKGPRMSECKRKEYAQVHGTQPPDEMMPDGEMTTGRAA
jgi:hypothetical protein